MGISYLSCNIFLPSLGKIDQEREGEQIDRALLKNVLHTSVEIGRGQMDYYENDFEASILKDTATYYSLKASCPDYVALSPLPFDFHVWPLLQAEECLKRREAMLQERSPMTTGRHPQTSPAITYLKVRCGSISQFLYEIFIPDGGHLEMVKTLMMTTSITEYIL
ncbi:hypothetical protein L6164_029899 [Bauhinia variegata]|uniref:Uncharacterized protein n=1 Tax=Bauhinia variegata TaxID=167791 RepID=A0ACB9LB02_BAUVA|nr:hypothetical protein L6164_029899 [Bauhinia variegata]